MSPLPPRWEWFPELPRIRWRRSTPIGPLESRQRLLEALVMKMRATNQSRSSRAAAKLIERRARGLLNVR
jgi:hypothetical protein